MKFTICKTKLVPVLFMCLISHVFAQDFSNTFESLISTETLKNVPRKLIPYPKEVTWNTGHLSFNNLKIESDIDLDQISIEIIESIVHNDAFVTDASVAVFKLVKNQRINSEGYTLKVSENEIEIQFKDESGRFYALQTLAQLAIVKQGKIQIPFCEIVDEPKHSVRGFLLDVGRNFISLDILKEQLDIMAKYKLNVFQWHLTDRPAWRIESKAYPKLNLAENHRPTRDPGKYYTYDEIRELIAYAKERHITIIPEIDMPGHSDSFVTSMGFKMESKQGMDALEVILNEFFMEIPEDLCPTIHLGSDEVHIENPDEFMTRMIRVCKENNREVIVWNPGLKIEEDVIRQTWQPKNLEAKGYKEIDSWNSYINNSEPMTSVPKILFKPIGYKSKNNIIGGILSLWPDVNLENETDFISQNPLYPCLLTYAWTTWTGDVTKTSDRYLTMLPERGTEAFKYLETFEYYLLHHKNQYLKNKPFQYVKQTNSDWLLSEPLSKEDAFIIEEQVSSGKSLNTENWKPATGNTIIVKDRFKQGGYYPEANNGNTVFAQRQIKVDHDQTIKVWIGFETPLRANRVYSGIPEQGRWDANGGTIWVNGKELTAPKWKNPGWKPSKIEGWGSKEDQEIPWAKEELYWTREPVSIKLQRGVNTIVFKVPGKIDYQNWMFTFAPLEPVKSYSKHYYERFELFNKEPDTEHEIIFLGNSITEGGNWKTLFPKYNVINRGISGDVTDGILNRIDEVAASQPSKVFLLAGTNDMAHGRSVDYVLKGIQDIVEAINEKSKNTEIYIQSILPVNPYIGERFAGHKANHQKIMEANKLLEDLAKTLNIEYIDLHKAMRNKERYLKTEYTHDGLHLTEKGYARWKQVIKKYVK
ncbi:family 20 glycosylhydrolase [Aestuariibaculum sp. M13]|uniref:family 20 glycosylhydrolase n=1 Tax=Aestuariibaculum sp. M13 TaxID=2967132 RepID=UPI002159EFBF|nr:family 20 glycosylhydrolase [Aestuariibaculum sp. M13]MCR8668705.1 family 20 glycosylhydrolase [Aestuariibaculum sp. M13]